MLSFILSEISPFWYCLVELNFNDLEWEKQFWIIQWEYTSNFYWIIELHWSDKCESVAKNQFALFSCYSTLNELFLSKRVIANHLRSSAFFRVYPCRFMRITTALFISWSKQLPNQSYSTRVRCYRNVFLLIIKR